MKNSLSTLSERIIRTSVNWDGANLPLAEYLAGRFTYRNIEQWKERIISGEITLNGKIVPPETVLALNDCIEYRPGDIEEPPADLDFKIVFEDDSICVIDKPGNLCMHPAGPFFKNTLWHLLCQRYGEIHFINRLDRETSGLLLAAKNSATAKIINKNRTVSAKNYAVIVHGIFPETLEANGYIFNAGNVIRKQRKFAFDMPTQQNFESASTRFTRIKSGNGFSLLKAELSTGRMHQIRATLHSLGYPVAGDKLYGVDSNFYLKQKSDDLSDRDREQLIFSRQALHSQELIFTHPLSNEKLLFSSPLPEEFKKITDNM